MRSLPATSVLALALLALRARPAEACSCDPGYATTAPADGETGVPLNVRIIVRNGPEAVPGPGYVLRGPGGDVLLNSEVIEQQWGHHMQVLTPPMALVPDTEYTLVAEYPIGEVRFTTGFSDDLVPPALPAVGTLDLATAGLDVLTSCGDRFNDVRLPIEIPADAVAVELTVTVDGWIRRHILLPDDLGLLANLDASCGPAISLLPGAFHDVTVEARDLAGNRSQPIRRSAAAFECPEIPYSTCSGVLSGGLAGCADGYEECEAGDDHGGCSGAPGAGPGAGIAWIGLRRRRRRRVAERLDRGAR